MQRWEYRTVRVEYDYSADVGGWVESGGDRQVVGWDAILNAYGVDGWELVGFSPQLSTVRRETNPQHVSDQFRLVFKRPVSTL